MSTRRFARPLRSMVDRGHDPAGEPYPANLLAAWRQWLGEHGL